MEIWDLDRGNYNASIVKSYMEKNGYDKGIHPKFTIGETIHFMTGANGDIPAKAKIKGINGDEIYVYSDCYWFPIKDDEHRKIRKCS